MDIDSILQADNLADVIRLHGSAQGATVAFTTATRKSPSRSWMKAATARRKACWR